MKRGILNLLVFALVWCGNAAAEPGPPPNIVYLISDDQTYRDFGFMGNEKVHTPNLDALAAQSACFVNGYVPTSVCRPSLVTLLTGLYPHQHGVTFNHGPPGNSGYNKMTSREEYERVRNREFALIHKTKTLPGILARERGYRSLQTGKFWEGHWRNGGFTEGMTIFEAPPKSQTYGGVRKLASGERVAHGNGDWGLQIGRETMAPITEFIDDCVAEKTPWLVWYAPYLPHQPHDSPERFFELARSRPGVAEHELPYFAAIAQFDETVGELVRYVEGKGLAENTVFVLVVDNGWSPSRKPEKSRPVEFSHTHESKRAPFDDGLRTPILIRWDGVVKSATHEELVSSIDLVPTFLSAAGAAAEKLPGIDLLPIAKGETRGNPDRTLFGEIYPGDATSLDNPAVDIAYRWARRGDYKLIVPHLHGKATEPWQGYLPNGDSTLYDVVSDPVESKNIIAEHPDIAADLRKRLDAWWSPVGG
ncbi:MAG: sulfatase-like hydrolase/transferase [Verrucomicrobiae bacterium]|nr:sulfatase-like hydrolase/transferase [Verrucomicrobiae bacterium]